MSHDDFAFEPVPGLPEHLPEGEQILWQGRPMSRALLRQALCLRWVVGYFLLLAVWRFMVHIDQVPAIQAFSGALPFVLIGMVVVGALWLTAWIQARATIYTITNRRVVLRIGAALNLTINLPFREINAAALDLRADGSGTIVLDLNEGNRLSYLLLWPHVRPWAIRKTQPALRCIPHARAVATLLADAAETRVSSPIVAVSHNTGAPASVAAE